MAWKELCTRVSSRSSTRHFLPAFLGTGADNSFTDRYLSGFLGVFRVGSSDSLSLFFHSSLSSSSPSQHQKRHQQHELFLPPCDDRELEAVVWPEVLGRSFLSSLEASEPFVAVSSSVDVLERGFGLGLRGGAVGVPCRSVWVMMPSYAGRGGVAGGVGGETEAVLAGAEGEAGGLGKGLDTTEPGII